MKPPANFKLPRAGLSTNYFHINRLNSETASLGEYGLSWSKIRATSPIFLTSLDSRYWAENWKRNFDSVLEKKIIHQQSHINKK